jgi:hypothetical protein
MSWTKTTGEGGTYEQPPTGPAAAVLTRIMDIGTHTDSSPMYGEQRRQQVVFMWELAEPYMSDGRPFTIQSFYTLSMHEKANLRLMLESWRGKPFGVGEEVEIDAPLGKACLINIGETAGGKAKVLSVSRLPQGMTAPTAQGPLLLFRTDQPDWGVFEQLSDFHRGKIESSEEWPRMKSHSQQNTDRAAINEQQNQDAQAQAATADFDDDIPF